MQGLKSTSIRVIHMVRKARGRMKQIMTAKTTRLKLG